MDTIAKAENVAMLWDYLLFSNMNKRFQLYVFGKSAVRGFEYFSKLLYVAAVNKKVAL
jgi:hypothetical protein